MNESELNQALNELKQDKARFNYVMARADGNSVEASLKIAGRSKGWFYGGLTQAEQSALETLACEVNAAPKLRARGILDEAVIEAAEVKVSGLRSRHDTVKQSAATEILDRALGKPNQPITGKDGGAIVVKVVYADTVDAAETAQSASGDS